MILCCSITFHGSHFLPDLNLCLAFKGLQGLLNFISPQFLTRFFCSVPQYYPITREGCFCLPAFTQCHPLYLDPHPSPFNSCPSFSIHFLHEAFFDDPDFRITLPFNVWTTHPTLPLNYILFYSLSVPWMCILPLNYILTSVRQEHIFFLCVFCRNSGELLDSVERLDSALAQCFV